MGNTLGKNLNFFYLAEDYGVRLGVPDELLHIGSPTWRSLSNEARRTSSSTKSSDEIFCSLNTL